MGKIKVAAGALGEFKKPATRESDVLKLLVGGRTNKNIANELSVSNETTKKHVQNIIPKPNATDQTDASVKAVRAVLID
ncbi:response regulator transcription factor [Candidatus Omnitrophota bacterium]